MANIVGIRFPFERTTDGGVFQVNNTTGQAIKSNLISLLTTKRGHRVMRGDLFSPLYDYIMEPWDEVSEVMLKDELTKTIVKFFPEDLEIKQIITELQSDGNTLYVEIVYSLLQLGSAQDEVKVYVPLGENETQTLNNAPITN